MSEIFPENLNNPIFQDLVNGRGARDENKIVSSEVARSYPGREKVNSTRTARNMRRERGERPQIEEIGYILKAYIPLKDVRIIFQKYFPSFNIHINGLAYVVYLHGKNLLALEPGKREPNQSQIVSLFPDNNRFFLRNCLCVFVQPQLEIRDGGLTVCFSTTYRCYPGGTKFEEIREKIEELKSIDPKEPEREAQTKQLIHNDFRTNFISDMYKIAKYLTARKYYKIIINENNN